MSEATRENSYEFVYLKESPCKKCERWESDFPQCLEECSTINAVHEAQLKDVEQKIGAEKEYFEEESEENLLRQLAVLVNNGKNFCTDCPVRQMIPVSQCRDKCVKFRVQERAGVQYREDEIPASVSYIQDIFFQVILERDIL